MLEGERDVGLTAEDEPLQRVATGVGGVDGAGELGEPLLDHGHQQLGAVGEVQVQRGRRHTDRCGHPTDSHAVRVAGFVEQRGGGGDELVAQGLALTARAAGAPSRSGVDSRGHCLNTVHEHRSLVRPLDDPPDQSPRRDSHGHLH